jgi:hypothetical protein
MKSLFVFAAATAAVLTSAVFATPVTGNGILHQERRAGDRLTILTDDQGAMCELVNGRAGTAGESVSGPERERTAIYLGHVVQISCVGRPPVKG